ncbi:heterokaryon incompatibility protein-domain-containing protein [Cercophora samala]|uniref:Heterokaryon incompatibility protein-domain-containing protein n=1 Tax=Cercophora samala TaxID=330535 RepID=A0AA39ZNG2_9PEZI|nr:heterokaryon incompatibility protein-domain-containing protein [Cercophora samala]
MASSSWHEASCSRPDVSLTEGIPFCMSCGSMGPLDDLEPSETPPAIPILSGKRSDLSLSWPFSVKYATQLTDEDGNDLGDDVLQSIVAGAVLPTEKTDGLQPDAQREKGESDLGSNSSLSTIAQQYRTYHQSLVPSDEVTGSDSIRLLRLSKGKGSEPLHGTLETRELRYFPEYEALSYTWADANGQASRTKQLYLGKEWAVFPITTNCEAALRHVRLPNTERYVWVDTVCINQFDNLERSHQVQLMPMIYATAQRVLVYLGQDVPERSMISKHLPAFSRVMEWSQKWDDLGPILQRPYFFRSWIIQEIASAKTALVASGDSWRVWPIYDQITDASLFLPWIKEFETRRYKTSKHLFQLITDCWTSQAYDPRDKVFSLLGVISGAAADGLVADYTLTVEQVYTGLASFVLKNQKQTDLFTYAAGYAKSPGLPSWVPQWDVLSRNWDFMAQIRAFHSLGIRADLMSAHKISSHRTEQVREPWFMDNMSKVMFADIDIHGPTGSLFLPGMKITDLSSDQYLRLPSNPYLKVLPDHPPSGTVYSGITCFRGPLFVMAMMEPSDDSSHLSVWFLHGVNTPVILRQSQSSKQNIFSFVSPCYVRVQTGVCMFQGTAEEEMYNADSYTVSEKGYTIGSDAKHQDKHRRLPPLRFEPRQRSVLTLPQFLGYSEMYRFVFDRWSELNSKVLQDGTLKDCAELELARLQALGAHAETTWTEFLQRQVPIVLLMPSLRRLDLMAPVGFLLEDLAESLKRMKLFWNEIESLLEAARVLGNTVEGAIRENYERRAAKLKRMRDIMFEQEKKRQELVEDEEAGQVWLKRSVKKLYGCSTEEEMGEMVKRMAGNLEERGGCAVDVDGEWEEEQSEWARDGLPCPIWYMARQGLHSWWSGMRKNQLEHGRQFLNDLVSGCGDWKRIEPVAVSRGGEARPDKAPREPGDEERISVNEDNLDTARGMRNKFAEAEVEVKLTIAAVKILMEKREEYARLMRGEWKKIVII